MKGIHAALLIAAGLGLAAAASPAEGRTTLIVEGGLGNKADGDECGPGEYLVGVSIRYGAWIDQIAIVCARLRPDGTFDPPRVSGKRMGGNGGGGPHLYTCSNKELVRAASFGLNATRQVGSIQLRCVGSSILSDRWLRAPHQATKVRDMFPQQCPSGEAVKGFGVRFGQHVNALGLICDTYRLPAAAAPPPVAATPATPPPPRAPLKSTGRSPGSTGSGGGTTTQEVMNCRGGGGMTVTPLSPGKSVYISYARGANAANLRPGECAWVNRPFKDEGRRLALQLSAANAQAVIVAAQGGTFTIRGNVIGTSFIMVSSVQEARPDGGRAASPTSDKPQRPEAATPANEKKPRPVEAATPANEKKQIPAPTTPANQRTQKTP